MQNSVKRKRRYLREGLFLITVLLALIGFRVALADRGQKEDVCWWEIPLIAHAGSGIDGKTLTNSLEAMNQAAKNGYRMIEVDFSFTNDGHLVLAHGWDEHSAEMLEIPEGIPDLEAFRATKIHRKYTSMTVEDLIAWMKKHRDIYIVTDTKCENPEEMKKEFQYLADVCEYDDELLRRFVVQVYDAKTCDAVMEVYEFPNIMYATYLHASEDMTYWNQVVEECSSRGIQTVSVSREYASTSRHPVTPYMEFLKEAGLLVCVHTVNTLTDVERMRDAGADIVMSDFLYEGDLQYLEI